MNRWQKVGCLYTVFFLVSGCSSGPKKKPDTVLQLSIQATQVINSDSSGQASPLQLRLYELNSTELFRQTDFLDLFSNDTAVLQSTLVSKHYLPTAWPGMTKTLTFTLNPETTSVAIVGEFAQYLSATTKASTTIIEGKSNHLKLVIEDNRIRLQPTTARLRFVPLPLISLPQTVGSCCEQ